MPKLRSIKGSERAPKVLVLRPNAPVDPLVENLDFSLACLLFVVTNNGRACWLLLSQLWLNRVSSFCFCFWDKFAKGFKQRNQLLLGSPESCLNHVSSKIGPADVNKRM